jgi:hypothetical protein
MLTTGDAAPGTPWHRPPTCPEPHTCTCGAPHTVPVSFREVRCRWVRGER